MVMRARRAAVSLFLLSGTFALAPAQAQVDAPLISVPTPRGQGSTQPTDPIPASTVRTVDGDPSDWVGDPSRFGGTATYSAGELVYQDHIFDAYGADDGRDAERTARHDSLMETAPEIYRAEPALQYVPRELGIPVPSQLQAFMNYGNLPFQAEADLLELRVAIDSTHLWILARTTTMPTDSSTALLVLIDNVDGSAERNIPFTTQLSSERADVALLLNGTTGNIADLATGGITWLPAGSVATDSSGYTNAIEAKIPLADIGTGPLSIAAVTRKTGSDLANVAFRLDEPVRGDWFDKLQAISLYEGNIDRFFFDLDLIKMTAGATERYVPGPGYHDRIFISSQDISSEGGENGIFQHYGVYVPSAYDEASPSPLQFWLHWRGGKAHTAAAVTPRIFKHYGEDQDSIVVSPKGRGTSRWYVGKGHVDFLEVWNDVMAAFNVDEDRVYVTGHSMGGWGSYLMTILYPDRFAAGAPVSGPVTQGAWTGISFPGCDGEPCYLSANGGDPKTQHTRRLLENLRNVPLAILHGAADELVPVAGVSLQAERLAELGYRHRYYLFPAYEHYSIPVIDEWAEAARYMHQFTRNPNPDRVTYIRDTPFERTVETIQADGAPLDFEFNRAYWMSELTPSDLENGVAYVDVRSLALAGKSRLVIPEAGGPAALGQTGPYAMAGLGWVDDPTSPIVVSNAFELDLRGASRVRLDTTRMALDAGFTITGSLTSDTPFELRLAGSWSSAPEVTIEGEPVTATLSGGVLSISIPAGTSLLSIS